MMKKFGPNFESENVAVLSHLIKFSLIDNEQPIYEQKVFKTIKMRLLFFWSLLTGIGHFDMLPFTVKPMSIYTSYLCM